LRYAAGLPVAAAVQPQVDAILSHRSLLASPDPVPPLCKSLTEALRTALVQSHAEFQTLHQQQILALTAAEAWQRLSNAEQAELLARFDLDNVPDIQTGTESELLACLERLPLDQWATRRDALPQRCQNALTEAARLREPTAVRVTLPSATIKVPADLDAWVAKVREEVLPRLPKGPVLL